MNESMTRTLMVLRFCVAGCVATGCDRSPPPPPVSAWPSGGVEAIGRFAIDGTPWFVELEKTLDMSSTEALSLVKDFVRRTESRRVIKDVLIIDDDYLFSFGDNKLFIYLRGYYVDTDTRTVRIVRTLDSVRIPEDYKRPKPIFPWADAETENADRAKSPEGQQTNEPAPAKNE